MSKTRIKPDKFKFGILLDNSSEIRYFANEVVKNLVDSNYADLALIIKPLEKKRNSTKDLLSRITFYKIFTRITRLFYYPQKLWFSYYN